MRPVPRRIFRLGRPGIEYWQGDGIIANFDEVTVIELM